MIASLHHAPDTTQYQLKLIRSKFVTKPNANAGIMQEKEKDDEEEKEEECSHQRRRSDALERYQRQLLDHLAQISARASELEKKS